MTSYVLSLAVGLGVGIAYGLLGVRSPAPPVIALLGLLGMLLGEQAVSFVKRWHSDNPVSAAWVREHCAPHILGVMAPAPDPKAICSDQITDVASVDGQNHKDRLS